MSFDNWCDLYAIINDLYATINSWRTTIVLIFVFVKYHHSFILILFRIFIHHYMFFVVYIWLIQFVTNYMLLDSLSMSIWPLNCYFDAYMTAMLNMLYFISFSKFEIILKVFINYSSKLLSSLMFMYVIWLFDRDGDRDGNEKDICHFSHISEYKIISLSCSVGYLIS